MSAPFEGRGLLPDNTEELLDDYRPAWSVDKPSVASAEEQQSAQEREEAVKEAEPEEISATLQKTAHGDYIAQVPIAEGRFATIGVQQTQRKRSFDAAKDAKDSARAHGALAADKVVRIVLCILVIAAIGIFASIIGTAVVNDITLHEAAEVFLQGLFGE